MSITEHDHDVAGHGGEAGGQGEPRLSLCVMHPNQAARTKRANPKQVACQFLTERMFQAVHGTWFPSTQSTPCASLHNTSLV